MSLVQVQGNASGTGTLTIAAPNTNSNFTLTLPTNTGTLITTASTAVVTQAMLSTNVAGNGPAFSAYSSAGQTLSGNTFTKLQFNTEEFDTASCFASDRFTPNVAGYYQAGGGFGGGAAQCTTIVSIYKNGSRVKIIANSPSVNPASYGTALVYLNGTTDYIELYGVLSVGQITSSGADSMYFQAAMVRSA
jgi:hypothetical protein